MRAPDFLNVIVRHATGGPYVNVQGNMNADSKGEVDQGVSASSSQIPKDREY